MGALRRWLGGAFVRIGRGLLEEDSRLGHVAEKKHEPDEADPTGEGGLEGMAFGLVTLSDAARIMVATAIDPFTSDIPITEPPLKGSTRERMMTERARREMGGGA